MTMNEALDALDGPGTIDIPTDKGRAEVDVVEADRLGVRVSRVKVERSERDVAQEAHALPGRLRSLPDRVEPSEVAPGLGGAILRTVPEEVRGRYFEVDVRPHHTEVRRVKVTDGERDGDDFVLTREQLEQLVDELS